MSVPVVSLDRLCVSVVPGSVSFVPRTSWAPLGSALSFASGSQVRGFCLRPAPPTGHASPCSRPPLPRVETRRPSSDGSSTLLSPVSGAVGAPRGRGGRRAGEGGPEGRRAGGRYRPVGAGTWGAGGASDPVRRPTCRHKPEEVRLVRLLPRCKLAAVPKHLPLTSDAAARGECVGAGARAGKKAKDLPLVSRESSIRFRYLTRTSDKVGSMNLAAM